MAFNKTKKEPYSSFRLTNDRIAESTDKYRRTIWRCNHKFSNDEVCTTPHLTNDDIQDYYLSALRKLLTDKDEIIAAFEQAKDTVFDMSALTTERDELQKELLVVSELMQQSMYENAHVVLDQAEYKKYYGSLTERFDKTKARLDEVKEVISDKEMRQATIEAFLDELKGLDGISEFQPALWYGLADYMTVYSKDDVRIRFKDGTEIRA